MSEAAFELPYTDQVAEPELEYSTELEALEDSAEPGVFSRLAHHYGRRTGALLLAGVGALGLASCDPESPRPDSVKGMVIETGNNEVKLGTCVKKDPAFGYGEGDLRSAGLARVRKEAPANGCVSTLTGGGSNPDLAKQPTSKFIHDLRLGDIVVKKMTVNVNNGTKTYKWTTR